MAKVLSIGGVFFKCKDPEALGKWYEKWLGFDIDSSYGGTSFFHRKLPEDSYSVWAPFQADTTYFEPSSNKFMFNLIVDDLSSALQQVKEGGASLEGEPEISELGAFGWFTDPEGNKVELWQPKPTDSN